MNYKIKTSKIIVYFWAILGLCCLFYSFFGGWYYTVPGCIFFLVAFVASTQMIEIIGLDVKYSSFIAKKSIKQIESIDLHGFSFVNSVKITGRGGSVIELLCVDDFSKLENFADEINNISK